MEAQVGTLLPQGGLMPVGYLAIGHGVRPSGSFDPGAIGVDGRWEHDEAGEVVAAATIGLIRSGVTDLYVETVPSDPNWSGSAKRANELKVGWAIEVHFDFVGGRDYGVGLFSSSADRRLAAAIASVYQGHTGLKGELSLRRDLGFLNTCMMPATIWECRRVSNYPREENVRMGEAIAHGVCIFMNRFYIPPNTTEPPRRRSPMNTLIRIKDTSGVVELTPYGPMPLNFDELGNHEIVHGVTVDVDADVFNKMVAACKQRAGWSS